MSSDGAIVRTIKRFQREGTCPVVSRLHPIMPSAGFPKLCRVLFNTIVGQGPGTGFLSLLLSLFGCPAKILL